MLNIVENFLLKYSIKDCTVLIAFSGGPDSVTLALLIDKLKKKFNLDLVLCYFNHGWRNEAKLEEEFTKRFANSICATYEIGCAPLNIKKNEEIARKFRYNFLENSAKKYNSSVVFLAHNQNDNVETFIYRLIKGTSVKGLCSIPEQRDIFYRPLLGVSKDSILEFLRLKNQEYMIDSSNSDNKYKRNFIRNDILPLFSKINPNFLDSVSNLIENCQNTRKILDSVIAIYYNSVVKSNYILRDEFLKLSEEIRYEIINLFFGDELKSRDRQSILRINDFILKNHNSKLSINSKKHLFIENNKIFLDKLPATYSDSSFVRIDSEGKYRYKNIELSIEKSNKPDAFPNSSNNTCFLNLSFPLYLRTRNSGDIFSPYGLKGKMKLKDYFINEKIPLNARDKIVLLAKEDEICWILGYKISENFVVKDKVCYRLSFRNMDYEK